MEFIADPCIVDIIGLFQLVDNALADITEWSDIIGKYSNVDAHFSISLMSTDWKQLIQLISKVFY